MIGPSCRFGCRNLSGVLLKETESTLALKLLLLQSCLPTSKTKSINNHDPEARDLPCLSADLCSGQPGHYKANFSVTVRRQTFLCSQKCRRPPAARLAAGDDSRQFRRCSKTLRSAFCKFALFFKVLAPVVGAGAL